METDNAGIITYIAILSMSLLLLMAFMGFKISQICESNAIDELYLEKAYYGAQQGAHWFVGYCKAGYTWDFKDEIKVIDDKDMIVTIQADPSMENPRHIMSNSQLKEREVMSRIHMYVTIDQNKHMTVVKVKPY